MFKTFTTLLFLFILFNGQGQNELNYPNVTYGKKSITANWVTHPDIAGSEDVVILFRNVFDVDNPSEDFIINISADNHYYLYVNNKLVTHGPQLGDIKHWKYETLNLKNYLVKGKNSVAVKVINFGKRRFLGMQSIFTSLMVNGCTENTKILTTTGKGDSWKCYIDPSYKAIEVNWRGEGKKSIIGGFYANNPTDFVDMNLYPTGWKNVDYNEGDWIKPVFFEGASSMGGSIAYLLEPRNLPLLTWETEKNPGTVVRINGMNKSKVTTDKPWVIEPNKKVSVLMDWHYVTNGYPTLEFSKGTNASIKINYAENLFGKHMTKGDRNEIEGKELYGYHDIVISNGKDEQSFTPNWMRTYRFVSFEIETFSETLHINTFVNHRSRTKIPSTAQFISDNQMYNEIFDICKRTVDICTQDYFLSDAYYETMQYVGDTKIHAQLWQTFSGSLAHTKNALKQFNQSRDAAGNILGAYPLRSTFIYPTYSLSWIDQIANYYDLSNDTALVKELKPGILHTLYGFETNMNAEHLVKKTPYRYFVDWYIGPNEGGGTATDNDGLNSAVVTLHFVHALQNAAKLLNVLGDTIHAKEFKNRAEEIKQAVYLSCYDQERKLFAERPDKTVYDQHTNIMAILTDAIPEIEQRALLQKILNEKDLLQASYYYRYYLFKAIKKVDAPELFDMAQKPWELMINQNMTTTLERFESKERPTRSEVHPWSASPAYFYFDYLAGISSMENNYKKIKVKPRFGILKTIKGVLPTPQGNIDFHLKKKQKEIWAEIFLPKGASGVFEWQKQSYPLVSGTNLLKVPIL
jgi:hypothetical protein